MRIQSPSSPMFNSRPTVEQNQRLAMLRASAAAGTSASASAGGVVEAPPAQTAAGTTGGPTDIAALMAAWGSDNGQFDLDGSGSVDAGDLAMALQENETAAAAPPSGGDVAGLMAAWGNQDKQYDVDGSGTVDATDLSLFLNGATNRSGTASPVDPMIESLVDRTFKARDNDGDGILRIEDFGNQHRAFMQVDSDADGMVSRDELRGALQTSFEAVMKGHPNVNLDAFATRWEHGLLDDHGAVPMEQPNFRMANFAKASSDPTIQPTYSQPSHAAALLQQRGTLVNAKA